MKAKILMLGTYHFGSCGEHLIENNPKNIMSDKKQEELKELIDKLLKFKPNKIAVEKDKDKEEELNSIYSRYLKSGMVIENNILEERNEVVQIGFRIGKALNHEKIYPLDKGVNLPMEWLEYCKNNEPKVYKNFMNIINRLDNEYKEDFENLTVLEMFKKMNDATNINNVHSDLYLYPNQVCAGSNYYGVDSLVEWYRRNLYIFSNLQKIAKENDKILIIYGAGHCKILRDFIEDYNEFELVDALEYLK